MRAIIDADPLAYIVGFGHDNMPLHYQCKKLDEFIEQVLEDVGADDGAFYLTGEGNFRFEVATILPYKGNRDSSHKPRFIKELREHMIYEWQAELISGMEADDACGIDAYNCRASDVEYVICSIDKDLLMLEGKHYNYKRREFSEMEEPETWRRFFTQILTGDSSDNIPGLFKLTGSKATKAIKEPLVELSTYSEMEAYCKSTYLEKGSTEQAFNEVATLLWMRRKPLGEEDLWNPTNLTTGSQDS